MMAKCTGVFSIIARSSRGDRIVVDGSNNLITDAGLNRMGVGVYIDRCFLGSGTAPSSETMTSLEALTRTTTTVVSTNSSARTSAPFYGSYSRVFRFAADGTERIFSEVGVGWATGLYARSLILDLLGNAAQIAVLGDESLDVIYELRMYPPLADQVSTVTTRGVERTLVFRATSVTESASWAPINAAANMNGEFRGYDGAIGSITGLPSGVSSSLGVGVTGEYSSGSLESSATLNVGPSSGNGPAGISTITTPESSGFGRYQVSISPPISKTSANYFSSVFRAKWGRKT